MRCCEINVFSSGTCERGTKGCVANHHEPARPEELRWMISRTVRHDMIDGPYIDRIEVVPESLLREVWEESGVSFDDPRLGYVEIQMTRSTWEALVGRFESAA